MSNPAFDLSGYLKDLAYIVNIDSGSKHPEGTAKVAEFFREKFVGIGWKVKVHTVDSSVGPCLEIVNTDQNNYDLLFMGHMDTVFAVGTAAERPFTIKENKAYGPGVLDMKPGLLYIYYVLESLQRAGKLAGVNVCAAFNSDEEISSRYSRPWLENLARKSKYALVLEAARANGNLVNERKGIGRYTIDISGVAAHAGVDHEKGRSAIQELSHWIQFLHSQTNYEIGTTVNVGLVSGGIGANTVAEHAKAEVDMRICTLDEAERIETLMHAFAAHPKTQGVTVKVSGKVMRPPMVPSDSTLQLCAEVEKIAADLGIDIKWTATGGGSDGNFSANLGVTTIDGLGPVGGSGHSSSEYLVVDSIEPRFHLLYRTIEHIIDNKG